LLHQEGSTTGALLLTPDGPVDLMQVTAVWYRRFAPGHALPADTPMRPAAVQESRATLAGLIEVLPAFHLDAVADVRRAGVKPLQLRLAAELGLPVPRTLVTNDPEAVRHFASECPGGVVAKTLSSFVVHDEEGRELAVYTSWVREEHLEDLDGLQLSPMQFQEWVPKAFELRCTVVGNRVFSAALDVGLLDRGKVDWRIEGSELAAAWRPHELPPEVEQALLSLLDKLGLNYAAIDLILTPDGRYVFLEVNPCGEFRWLNDLEELSIAEAIAGVLTGEARRT